MDDSLIVRGPGAYGPGNTFIREILNVITASGQAWIRDDATQLSQAIFNQVFFENNMLFFEGEILYMYDV